MASPLPLAVVVATFLSVACCVGLATSALLRRASPERKRLREFARKHEAEWEAPAGLTDAPNKLAERICRVLPRSEQRMSEMRRRLVNAGHRSAVAPVVFAAAQIVCAITAGVVVLLATRTGSMALLALVVGFTVPGFWLSRQVRRRSAIIRAGLPDVVDLLVVCLESGCGLDQAILRTGEELGLAYAPLQDELALVVNEIRAGTPRNEAFRHLSERTNVDVVGGLVSMLVQTDRYGTSIAQALRVHADLLRTSRRQRAEEKAGKASVKLVIPLVLCLFPAFYILTLGPAILQFIRALAAVVAGE